jgi:hypothetical protein
MTKKNGVTLYTDIEETLYMVLNDKVQSIIYIKLFYFVKIFYMIIYT